MKMKKGNFKESPEWQMGCVKSKKICFLPHKSFHTGQRERYLVVYPLANMIVRGKLIPQTTFSSFSKDAVLAYCNLRPEINGKKNFRPDILAFSTRGDVLIVEGKLRRKSDGGDGRVVSKLSHAATELAGYASQLKKFARNARKNPFEIRSELHRTVYSDIHGFPAMSQFISDGFSISSPVDQAKMIEKLNDAIAEGRAQYGLAFNGPPDKELNVPGYNHIDTRKIEEAANAGWNRRLGTLHLFMIDPFKKRFKYLIR